MLIIRQNDFCPILDLHYRLLAKSEYGIKDRFVITFDEIDTPTAKEAAEIRQIEANTDATYINAGILAPDEVRQKLREDEDSGYSALEDEEEEAEEDLFGGSETSQDPFNMDEEIEWRTTKNGVHFPLTEKTTKKSCKEFFNKKENKEKKTSPKKELKELTNKIKELDKISYRENPEEYKKAREQIKEIAKEYRNKEIEAKIINATLGDDEYNNIYNEAKNNITNAENQALTTYTGNTYKDINKSFRNNLQLTNENKNIVDNITNAINKTEIPKNITVMRTTGKNNFLKQFNLSDEALQYIEKVENGATPDEKWIKELNKELKNKHYKEKAFMSTAYNMQGIKNFEAKAGEKPILLRINVPKGTKAFPMESLSKQQGENELLFDKGQKLKIKKVDRLIDEERGYYMSRIVITADLI